MTNKRDVLDDKILIQNNNRILSAEKMYLGAEEGEKILNKPDIHIYIDGVDPSSRMTTDGDPFQLINRIAEAYHYTETFKGDTWNEQLNELQEAIDNLFVYYVISYKKETKPGVEFALANFSHPIESFRDYIDSRIVGFIVCDALCNKETADGYNKEDNVEVFLEDYVFNNLSIRNALYNDDLWRVKVNGRPIEENPCTIIKVIECISEVLLLKPTINYGS